MNAQIQKIAKESGLSISQAYSAEFNKFAELIIKECARVASDYDGAHYVGTAIEQYFGVE